MIYGYYLIENEQEAIWFETTSRAKSFQPKREVKTKDGIQYEIAFSSDEARESFDSSVRNAVRILH